MGKISFLGFAGAVVLALAGSAVAQEFKDEGPAPEAGPAKKKLQFWAQLEHATEALDTEIGSLDSKPGAPGGVAPFNHSDAERGGCEYYNRHDFIGVRFGADYTLNKMMSAGAYFFLGAVETILTVDGDTSAWGGGGGAPKVGLSTNLETGFAFRFGFWGTYKMGKMDIEGKYELTAAWPDFDNDAFLAAGATDGDFDMLGQRLRFTVYYPTDYARALAGIGFYFYDATADVKITGAPGFGWEANYDNSNYFFFELHIGGEIQGPKGVYARVELSFIAELTYHFSVGYKL
ncbi:MAG: hypothetical protein L0216_06080 [Planctomycetales bacterium]|nr:hypothetical protein [Planctomycetales bacterium]